VTNFHEDALASGTDKAVVVIDGKKYWAHVVETAKFIRQMQKEAKTQGEKDRVTAWIKRGCAMFESLEEVMSYGDRLDDLHL